MTLAEKLEKVVSASDRVEHKVKIELVTAISQLQPIGDQRLGHAKHRVRCQIRVVFAKDMGDLFEPGTGVLARRSSTDSVMWFAFRFFMARRFP